MPPPLLQDFAKLTEVQFLDNLRRGASINYADLQPNPVPQNLAEAYRLLTIISPQVRRRQRCCSTGGPGKGGRCGHTHACIVTIPKHVASSLCCTPPCIVPRQVTTLENGIRILQEEVQARRVRWVPGPVPRSHIALPRRSAAQLHHLASSSGAQAPSHLYHAPPRPPRSAADAEQLVGQLNPAAFQKAQAADEDGLEVLRGHVGLLKKVCRQKAVYCLKDVRRQMEESRGSRLRHNLEVLQADLAFAQASREQLEEVARAAQQYVAEQHSRMAEVRRAAAGRLEGWDVCKPH